MKTKIWVVAIASILLFGSLGCALVRVVRQNPEEPTAARTPLVVIEVAPTFPPTFTPTATQLPTATRTATPTLSPTPQPSPTPAPPTDTPAPTDTPEPPPTRAPVKPTDTPVPPTATPVPFTASHPVVGTLTVREPAAEYRNGAKVKVHWTVKNTSGGELRFGILGITVGSGTGPAQFQSSRSGPNNFFNADEEIGADDTVSVYRFGNQIRGPANLYLSMCFAKYEECQKPNADWENITAPVTINIVP